MTIGNYLTNEFLLEMAFGHAKLAIRNDRTRQGDDELANRTAAKYGWAGRPTTATEMVTIGLSDFSVGRFLGFALYLLSR